MNLKNKKILITGASGGIGNCLVEKFSNLESNIIATGTNEQKLANLKKNFQKFIQRSLNLMNIKRLKNSLIMLKKNWKD